MMPETFTSVIDLLAHQAQARPDKVAADDYQMTITYAELDAQSTRAAGLLCRFVDEGAGKPIPVLVEKGVPTLVAYYAIAKAGCFYVPVNAELPAERLRLMFEVLEPPVVVALDAQRPLLDELGVQAHVLDIEELMDATLDLHPRTYRPAFTDPLYAIFTSGSTGVPKCVLNSHGALSTFIASFVETFGLTEHDVMANQAPFDFDVSLKDVYGCLATGATLVMVPRACFSFPVSLIEHLVAKQPTVLVWAVSALVMTSQFKALDSEELRALPLRMVMFSGEVMPPKHLVAWAQAFPQTQFVNLYGPTEITCNCTYYCIEDPFATSALPIGRPFAHNDVMLLQGEDPVEPGAMGEMCVSGPTVALGYYRNEEQTQRAFTRTPAWTGKDERLYRTGDLAYVNEDGLLVFAGRIDNQIKHLGHRIELTEIEHAADAVPDLARCCCVYDEVKARLILCYQTESGEAIKARAFSSVITKTLPRYMLPNRYVLVEDFPRTRNGKIDRRALKQLVVEG